MSEVSSTRLYLGNLPRTATKSDIEQHFAAHGTGKITEIKLMNGFGFIEYEDALDARDVVPAFHGSTFMGERMIVQFARGARKREDAPAYHERTVPRPRRTLFRMSITNLPPETSWQDLKDFARQSGLDVVYSEVGRERDGRGFVEYETKADLLAAVEKLDGREFKGVNVHCIADEQTERPRDRYRSRSPRGRYPGPPRGGGGGYDDYYNDRRPPRDYEYDYRRRSPPRDVYAYERYNRDDRGYGRPPSRGPPRGRGPVDDGYPPPRSRYEDAYPPAGRPPYGPPSPRRRTPPPPGYEPRPRY
ncbi:hypothetical protein, variant [Verruconis gallopava]|uniref:RRM domain-containing protein n=1 Tax=Verruconis gallopava TaxID=253628 RepID=A0A0D1XZJ8_9PEZI|nr:hypothetical protein, variant [Verruconis gallopava]KIW08241.1 hypothetical protein, variant [Verruconis gallopava]